MEQRDREKIKTNQTKQREREQAGEERTKGRSIFVAPRWVWGVEWTWGSGITEEVDKCLRGLMEPKV